MYDDPMETVEYMWVNIRCMLEDWIVGFCNKNAEMHHLGISAQLVSAQNELLLLWLAGINYVEIRTRC